MKKRLKETKKKGVRMEDPLPEHVWDYIHYLNHKTDQGEVLLELEVNHEYMLLFDVVMALKREQRGREHRVKGIVFDAEEVVRHCEMEQPSEIVKQYMRGIVEQISDAKKDVELVKFKVERGNSRYLEEWCEVMKRFNYLYSN